MSCSISIRSARLTPAVASFANALEPELVVIGGGFGEGAFAFLVESAREVLARDGLVPNRDNIRHHVYSFSPAKRFELPLYAGVPTQPVLFDKAGVVVLGCNIHDWMIGYIYVSDSPWFGKTGADGTVREMVVVTATHRPGPRPTAPGTVERRGPHQVQAEHKGAVVRERMDLSGDRTLTLTIR